MEVAWREHLFILFLIPPLSATSSKLDLILLPASLASEQLNPLK